MTAPAKYGRRNVPKMIAQIDALRHAIRAEGTPAVQAAWDAVEEHIDYAYRPTANEQLREALKPFAKAGELFADRPTDPWCYAVLYNPAAGPEYQITEHHVRAAHEAMRGEKP